MSLYSLQIERQVLGGLLKNPDVLPEIDSFTSVADFYHQVHQSIYSVIHSSFVAGENIDKTLISDKLISIGITSKDHVNIHEYLDSIIFSSPNPKAVIDYARTLIKYRIRREILETTESIDKYINECGDESIDDIISKSDGIYSKKILSYELDDNPENILDSFLDEV